ncbi:MAG: TPM domain-containing protein [Clostridia bacterium]|nr:TPM domain-containing protein [Clostridia bacterium]
MKKRTIAVVLIALLTVFSLPYTALSDIPAPGEDFYYLDQANVLSDETEAAIFFNNESLYEACGSQIVIAVVNNLGGMNADDYAYAMFNEWGVGDKDENNGVLLVMAIREDTYYAALGLGAERILDAGTLQGILDDDLEPDFAQKDYDAGAEKVFRALFEKVRDYYGLNLAYRDGAELLKEYSFAVETDNERKSGEVRENPPRDARHEEKSGGFMNVFLGIIIVSVILLAVFGGRRIRRRPYRPVVFHRPVIHSHRPPRPPRVHHRPVHFGSHRPASRSRPSGGGGFTSRSSFGGSRGGSSRSGGFGGARGGGGSSRGGGAGRR